MSNHSILAMSGGIVAAAATVSWLFMYSTVLFGLARSRPDCSEERTDWRERFRAEIRHS